MEREEPRKLRFVDLCAGLGGFHRALGLAEERVGSTQEQPLVTECVLASELDADLARLYVRNFPAVVESYTAHFPIERVSELERAVRKEGLAESAAIYDPHGSLRRVHGDLKLLVDTEQTGLRLWPDAEHPRDWIVPEHDLLCAGFPCQPFSKSGSQRGFADLRGTVFHMIALVLEARRPSLVLLENVGNFERHDEGNTWTRVLGILEDLGYEVAATRHKASGGKHATGLLSPHHVGLPHHRERFFIIAQARGCDWAPSLEGRNPFPARSTYHDNRREADQSAKKRLIHILASAWRSAPSEDLRKAQIPADRVTAASHWNQLLEKLDEQDEEPRPTHPRWQDSMPSFPIWGYELDPFQWYPIDRNPRDYVDEPTELSKLRRVLLDDAADRIEQRSGGRVNLLALGPVGERAFLARPSLTPQAVEEWINTWPAYAAGRARWPAWKVKFLEQNREWAIALWSRLDPHFLREWLDRLVTDVPAPSNQKLEWNCKGEALDLWEHILQFRPSGLRVKRLRHVPALVAMTTTQIPVVPRIDRHEPAGLGDSRARGRHLLPEEALRLQGFPAAWARPRQREAAFRAFGNAVHCELVSMIFQTWLGGTPAEPQGELALQAAGVEGLPAG